VNNSPRNRASFPNNEEMSKVDIDQTIMAYSIQQARDIFDKAPMIDKPANPEQRVEMICRMASRIYKLKIEGK